MDSWGQIGEGVLERLLTGDEQDLVADAKLDPVDLPIRIGGLHRRRYRRGVLLSGRTNRTLGGMLPLFDCA